MMGALEWGCFFFRSRIDVPPPVAIAATSVVALLACGSCVRKAGLLCERE